MKKMNSFNRSVINDSNIVGKQCLGDSVDKKNKEFIARMEVEEKIAYGLSNEHVPITLNNLIDFCKEQDIDFNSPVFLECSEGYFPLAHYHKAETLNCLVLTDAENS